MEGGGQCSARNFSLVTKVLGAENVDSYYIHEDDKKRSLRSYVQGVFYTPMGYFFGLTPARCREITQLAKSYDVVFIDRSVFGILARHLKQGGYQGQIITHFHNIERIYFDAKLSRHLPFRSMLLACVEKNDRLACQYADRLIALNDRDSRVLDAEYHRPADVIVPITLPDKLPASRQDTISSPSDTTSKRLRCLFLGSYFAANNEGILWFVRNVLPYVDVEVKIVGKGMARLKAESPELSDIEVVSDAPDLRPYLDWADAMVLPIFSGSGMKVKTCESLMNGKNIIGTPEAFEGYDVDYDRVGGCCQSAEDFIRCINNFAENPRPRWNAYSRQMYLEKYSDQAIENLFRSLLLR